MSLVALLASGLMHGPYYTTNPNKSLDLSGPVNLVVDGNSIMTSFYSSVGDFGASLVQYEPLASAVTTRRSVAASGQTFQDMVDDHTDVDTWWRDDSTNILIVGETRNQIVVDWGDGITDRATLVARCKTAIIDYLAAVRSTHPDWRIIILGTLPSGGTSGYATQNEAFVEVDEWVRANVETLDLYAWVGFRNWPAFAGTGLTWDEFSAYPDWWQETAPRFTHPKDPGKNAMATNVNAVVQILTGE